MHATLPRLKETVFPAITRQRLSTVQLNVGYRCNQACLHCHVNAGPTRTEVMGRETAEDVLAFMARAQISTLDVTGGAPELNPHFRYVVEQARTLGAHVIDRCNLTILEVQGQEDLAGFLAEHEVEVIASLPCYSEENVEAQRGKGVFEASLRGLQRLNAQGYGRPDSPLQLNLVYNPQGPVLPPPQAALEQDYRKHLQAYGISFNKLYTLANMPIQRFGSTLISRGEFDAYMALLRRSHSEANLDGVMCRTLISVDWQGYVYDCDFNQMLGMPLGAAGDRARVHLRELQAQALEDASIRVAGHCYGCTAGQGSSCAGALQGAS